MSASILDQTSKVLAVEFSRLVHQRIKADDFGTRPVARDVLAMIAEWLENQGEGGAATMLLDAQAH